MIRSSNIKVNFAIREARGLSANEKLFLYTVESRGEMWTTAKRAQADMSLSRTTYYKVRRSLVELGVLSADTRTGRDGKSDTSRYTVNLTELLKLQVSTESASTSEQPGVPPREAQSAAQHHVRVRDEGPARVGKRMSGVREMAHKENHEDHHEDHHEDDLQEQREDDKREVDGRGTDATEVEGFTVEDLLSRIPRLGTHDIELIIEVMTTNRIAVPELRSETTPDGTIWTFRSAAGLSIFDLVTRLKTDRSLLGDLVRALPESELTLAFRIGLDDYKFEVLRRRFSGMTNPIGDQFPM